MAAPAHIARENGRKGGRHKGALARVTELKARELAAKNETPLDVMIDNMLYWRKQALRLGTLLDEKHELILLFRNVEATPETMKEFMNLLRDYNEIGHQLLAARDKSQDCAADAAPYVHPRLTTVAVKTPNHQGDVHFTLMIGDASRVKSIGVIKDGKEPAVIDAAPASE